MYRVIRFYALKALIGDIMKKIILGIILITIILIGNTVYADDDATDEINCSKNFYVGLSIGIIAGIIFSRVVIRKVIK